MTIKIRAQFKTIDQLKKIEDMMNDERIIINNPPLNDSKHHSSINTHFKDFLTKSSEVL